MTHRTIITCPGIGDFLWLAMKLQPTGERFNIRMTEQTPQRGHQLKELLPDLIASHEYKGVIMYSEVNQNNIQNKKGRWAQIDEQEFYLSANNWLENGLRIEQFLPDLPTSYTLNYHTSTEDQNLARTLLPAGPAYIGIYTSAYSNARHWNGWKTAEWVELIKMLHQQRPDVQFVLVGAPYDIGIPEEIMKYFGEKGIGYVNTIGQPLPVVVELMKIFSYFIGFPSGLSILNETLGKDGVMFYAPHIKGIMNAWADPNRIADGSYKGCLFCEPGRLYEWMRNEYKIFDRL